MRLPTPMGSPVIERREDKSTLHDYVYKNDVDNVKKLLASGDVDLSRADGKGRTPVFVAASFNRCEILDMLLTAGCDVNVRDIDRVTPLIEAVEHGNTEAVKRLVKQNGIHIDARDRQGRTALMKAAYYDYAEIAKILLKDAGASPNILDIFGQSALLLALREGSHVTVDCLLKHGCDVTVTDRLGQTALYIAIHSPCNKSLDSAKRLCQSGYDVRNDRSWLLSEVKHNLFYQDDSFYTRLVSLLRNTINDTTNNNSTSRRAPMTPRRTSRFSSSTDAGSFEIILEEENETFTAPKDTPEIKPTPCKNVRRSSKEFTEKLRQKSCDIETNSESPPTEQSPVSKQMCPSQETKSPGRSILKETTKNDLNVQTGNTSLARRGSGELLAACAKTTSRPCVYGKQLSVPCDIVTKATVQPPKPTAPKIERQMSLPVKPVVRFSTQILINGNKCL